MIVTINDKNRENYNNLFIESYKYLKSCTRKDEEGNDVPVFELEDKDGFASLPEYYSHMNDFFSTGAWRYIFLPLDENDFQIDLNNRRITVPSNFNSFVSVQSDNLAETIIFCVDRYFDYMDLANTNIYVQWKLPNGTESATKINMIDLNTPDKIRFAWPISDLITKDAGSVRFSVRFFIVSPESGENHKLVYSLNTLENSINIAQTNQHRFPAEVEETADLFGKVIINSNFYDEGVAPPVNPVFVNDIYKKEGGQLVLVDKANLNDDNTLKLYAEALIYDNGDPSYTWYYSANQESIDCSKDARFEVGYEMIAFNAPKDADKNVDWSINYVQGQRYYEPPVVGEGQELPVENLLAFDRVVDVRESKAEVLYRPFSRLTILNKSGEGSAVVGAYSVEVKNVIHGNASAADNTEDCVLPAPNEVIITKDLSENQNFLISNGLEGDDQKDVCTLEATVKEVDDSVDVITYTWYKKTTEDGNFAQMKDLNDNPISGNSIEVADRGWYQAKIVAKANRETTETVSTKVAKVTAEPVAPIFDTTGFDMAKHRYDLSKLNGNEASQFTASVPKSDDKLYSESITYQWYFNKKDAIDDQQPYDNNTDTLQITNDMEAGYYHCKATNTLNGKTASTHSHEVEMVVTIFKPEE